MANDPEAVEVQQSDRDAAATVNPQIVGFGGATGCNHLVKAFARYRIALLAQARVDAIEEVAGALQWYDDDELCDELRLEIKRQREANVFTAQPYFDMFANYVRSLSPAQGEGDR